MGTLTDTPVPGATGSPGSSGTSSLGSGSLGSGSLGTGSLGTGPLGTGFAGAQRTPLQPPDEITRGLFERGRRLIRTQRVATDACAAAALLVLSSMWLANSHFAVARHAAASPLAPVVQTALIVALVVRRLYPTKVFLVVSAIAFFQWLLGFPLLGDAALLIALYTVAAHESRVRALLAAGLMEVGAIIAAVRWEPADTVPLSMLFLSATVIAALFAGLTAASGSRYLAWMDERARRLALERDQQAVIAASAERTRIARELHDIVSHSLSVVITLADAAAVVSRTDPGRGAEAMTEVSEACCRALSDMRAMFGVLRARESSSDQHAPSGLQPQPGVAQLGALIDHISATGLGVDLTVEGTAFPVGAAVELTVYRIVQEALTNALRHASARRAEVTIQYAEPLVRVLVTDDGTPAGPVGLARQWHRRHARTRRAARRHAAGRSGPRRRLGRLRHPPLRRVSGGHRMNDPRVNDPRMNSSRMSSSRMHTSDRAGSGQAKPPGAISVLLADDQPLLRRGFRMILEAEDNLTVVAEAGDGEEAVDLAGRHRPDVVLMDIRMPGTDGIEATRRITSAEPGVRVLVLTTFDLDEYAFGALRAGASGFLLKDVRPNELVTAVRTVAAGDAIVSPRVTRRLLEESAQVLPVSDSELASRYPQLSTLTDREHEVLISVARGLSNTEIAASLFVSETTVKSHVGRILAKLSLRDRVQVVVLAYEAGLIRPGMRPTPG